MTTKRVLKAEDLFRIDSVADPRVSPTKKEAVFVKTTLDQDENKYVSNLYHLDLKTNDATQWTYGKQSVSHPRWSNDGQNILFLSNRDDKNQVYILSTKGGEAKKLQMKRRRNKC